VKKIVFRFNGLFDLWRFKQTANLETIDVKYALFTLTCHANECTIQLAQERYGAAVLEVEKISISAEVGPVPVAAPPKKVLRLPRPIANGFLPNVGARTGISLW